MNIPHKEKLRILQKLSFVKRRHAKQTPKGFIPIQNKVLTDARLEKHIAGEDTVGVYTTRKKGNKAGFAAIDIDHKVRAEHLHRLGKTAKKTKKFSEIILEDTGGKGHHVWLIYKKPTTARRARKDVRKLMAKNPKIGKYEVYPKQDKLIGKRIGNLIKLPFGINKRTGKPSKVRKIWK